MKHLSKIALSNVVLTGLLFTPSLYAANYADETAPLVKDDKIFKTVSSAKTQNIDDIGEMEKEATAEKDEDSKKSFHIHHQDHDEEDNTDDDSVDFRLDHNQRDGFYLGVSAVSSFGDDFSFPEDHDPDSEFAVDISYRVQLLGLFIESPGLSSRRIHGMYSMPAWGLNFINTDDWSFDLFYQYSGRGIEGLSGIQIRNKDERAGLRATGYFENSQLQMIYSPVSRNNDGSDGIEASLSYSYTGQFKNWSYYANLGVQYRSKEVTPYDVSQVDQFTDDNLSTNAGISSSAEIGLEYPLSTDWVFGSFVGYTALSDRTVQIRQDNVDDGYRAGILLTYVF